MKAAKKETNKDTLNKTAMKDPAMKTAKKETAEEDTAEEDTAEEETAKKETPKKIAKEQTSKQETTEEDTFKKRKKASQDSDHESEIDDAPTPSKKQRLEKLSAAIDKDDSRVIGSPAHHGSVKSWQFKILDTHHTLTTGPKFSFIVQSCNTLGNCSSGFAKLFKNEYHNAYQRYVEQVNKLEKEEGTPYPKPGKGLGKAIIIPPQAHDSGPNKLPVFHVCLLVSRGFGAPGKDGRPGKDSKASIRSNTRKALKHFKSRLTDKLESNVWNEIQELMNWGPQGQNIDIYSPRINSGGFHIDWDETRGVIEDIFAEWRGRWYLLPPLRGSKQSWWFTT